MREKPSSPSTGRHRFHINVHIHSELQGKLETLKAEAKVLREEIEAEFQRNHAAWRASSDGFKQTTTSWHILEWFRELEFITHTLRQCELFVLRQAPEPGVVTEAD